MNTVVQHSLRTLKLYAATFSVHARLILSPIDPINAGWYERVAQQLPVHKELAQIIRAGLALLEGFSNKNSKVSTCIN